MPLFSYQYRNGDTTLSNDYQLSVRDLDEAVALALSSLRQMSANLAAGIVGGSLEIVDEDGDVVASLPIVEAITRH